MTQNYFYSDIIEPETYNQILSEHLYIEASDRFIIEKILNFVNQSKCEYLNILDLGCGPGRITFKVLTELKKTNKNINLTALDIDLKALNFARKSDVNKEINFAECDILDFNPEHKLDIIFSQGFHHHFPKNQVKAYLDNIYRILKTDGLYLVGDEFLPEYTVENDRQIKAVIWYSHIISGALNKNFDTLAREEVKTFLDDIFADKLNNFKSDNLINFVLNQTQEINNLALNKDQNRAKVKAKELIKDPRRKQRGIRYSNRTVCFRI